MTNLFISKSLSKFDAFQFLDFWAATVGMFDNVLFDNYLDFVRQLKNRSFLGLFRPIFCTCQCKNKTIIDAFQFLDFWAWPLNSKVIAWMHLSVFQKRMTDNLFFIWNAFHNTSWISFLIWSTFTFNIFVW